MSLLNLHSVDLTGERFKNELTFDSMHCKKRQLAKFMYTDKIIYNWHCEPHLYLNIQCQEISQLKGTVSREKLFS